MPSPPGAIPVEGVADAAGCGTPSGAAAGGTVGDTPSGVAGPGPSLSLGRSDAPELPVRTQASRQASRGRATDASRSRGSRPEDVGWVYQAPPAGFPATITREKPDEHAREIGGAQLLTTLKLHEGFWTLTG